ncbi:ATP-binding protein [Gordonia sp. HY002]|uniref:sensor histidine kinase n=1 Tax=Gordonia zhenghanii TaxID=2911516 RepID=UPI001EF111EC|nr:ATP-binding protein [Gordonia zhenghanii]MCF8568740.1 ATP-binding protein [Gordonia zhenghanii]MCF8607043.1 ATP-binding protein [Gordonia zhenghanii]
MNEYRMRRAAALTVAICTIAVTCVSGIPMIKGAQVTATWWTPMSAVAVVAAALVLLGVVLSRAGRRVGVVRAAVLALAATDVAALALWFPAWSGTVSDVGGTPPIWMANNIALPAVALATLFPARWSLVYTVIGLGLLADVQQSVGFGGDGWEAYLNQVMTFGLLAVFLTMLGTAMHIAREVDRRRSAVLAATVESASDAARAAERTRLDSVVRDGVIGVLRGIAPGRPEDRQRDQARIALAELDGSVATDRPGGWISAADAVIRLRESAIAYGDDILVAVDADDDAAELPDEVVDTLGDALSEAVGNAVAHAGPHASTAVVGHIAAGGVRLRVVDDGCGFDLAEVAPDRSGIAVGITGRLAALAGGRAQIDTAPNDGTMISLEWVRP